MLLSWNSSTPDVPSYMPLWTISVDTSIMKDHDDFWNPQIVRLIALLFQDAYDQADKLSLGVSPGPTR